MRLNQGGAPKPPTKADKIRVLLSQGWSPRDCAEIAQASLTHVYEVRDQQRGFSVGMTLRQEVSRLRQDLSDLRKFCLFKLRDHVLIPKSSQEKAKPKLHRVV